jgi:hypothetical protein
VILDADLTHSSQQNGSDSSKPESDEDLSTFQWVILRGISIAELIPERPTIENYSDDRFHSKILSNDQSFAHLQMLKGIPTVDLNRRRKQNNRYGNGFVSSPSRFTKY